MHFSYLIKIIFVFTLIPHFIYADEHFDCLLKKMIYPDRITAEIENERLKRSVLAMIKRKTIFELKQKLRLWEIQIESGNFNETIRINLEKLNNELRFDYTQEHRKIKRKALDLFEKINAPLDHKLTLPDGLILQSSKVYGQLDKLHPTVKENFILNVIPKIIQDPKYGIHKVEVPRNIRIVSFTGPGGDYRAAYKYEEGKIILVKIGPHENFYNDLRTGRK